MAIVQSFRENSTSEVCQIINIWSHGERVLLEVEHFQIGEIIQQAFGQFRQVRVVFYFKLSQSGEVFWQALRQSFQILISFDDKLRQVGRFCCTRTQVFWQDSPANGALNPEVNLLVAAWFSITFYCTRHEQEEQGQISPKSACYPNIRGKFTCVSHVASCLSLK